MQPIYSGTTRERMVRTAVLMILILGYSAWSLRDGYLTYPRANVVTVLETKLGITPPDPLPTIDPRFTARFDPGISAAEPPETFEEAVSRLGGKPYRPPSGANEAYYFGPSGYLELLAQKDGKAVANWIDGPVHRASDIWWQKLLGFGVCPIGLAFLVQLIRVLKTRVSLTDDGLRLGGKGPIPFDAMTGILADRYRKTGYVDLEYSLGGKPLSARLDNYAIKEFRAILTAICEAKGFLNPVQPDQPTAPDADAPDRGAPNRQAPKGDAQGGDAPDQKPSGPSHGQPD